jgi:hypothetical protein
MSSFGERIEDLPVDKEQHPSLHKDLLVSIFAPKEEIEGYSTELKAVGVAAVMFVLLSTDSANQFIRQYNKNTHLVRLVASLVSAIGFYYYTTSN